MYGKLSLTLIHEATTILFQLMSTRWYCKHYKLQRGSYFFHVTISFFCWNVYHNNITRVVANNKSFTTHFPVSSEKYKH